MREEAEYCVETRPVTGTDTAFFRQLPLFTTVDEETASAVVQASTRRVYGRQELIGAAEEKTRVGLVVAGVVRLYRLSEHGDEITVMVLEPGDVFGLRLPGGVVEDGVLREAASDETVVLYMPRDTFMQVLKTHPGVGLALIDQALSRFGELWQRFEERVSHSVRTRVAREMAREAQRNDGQRVRMTHDEMAKWLGTHVTKVSREIGFFRKQGWITSQPYRSGIDVMELTHLANFTDDER